MLGGRVTGVCWWEADNQHGAGERLDARFSRTLIQLPPTAAPTLVMSSGGRGCRKNTAGISLPARAVVCALERAPRPTAHRSSGGVILGRPSSVDQSAIRANYECQKRDLSAVMHGRYCGACTSVFSTAASQDTGSAVRGVFGCVVGDGGQWWVLRWRLVERCAISNTKANPAQRYTIIALFEFR